MKVKTYELTNTIEVEELEAGIIIDYSIEASDGKNVNLPSAFGSEFRPDLIRRAVHASRANRRQSYGHREHGGKRAPQPGMKHSVEWWGGTRCQPNHAKSGARTGAQNPHTRGGRRAHGPMVLKDWSQKLNSKKPTLRATLRLQRPRIQRRSPLEVTNSVTVCASYCPRWLFRRWRKFRHREPSSREGNQEIHRHDGKHWTR